MSEASVAILLTPPGASAIAVVRITGGLVPAFLASNFTGRPGVGKAAHGDLSDGGKIIDDPVVVLVDAQTADLNLHGGPWVVRATLDLLAANGFQITATPAVPLPAIATDATEAIEQEMLAVLPLARTELAVRVLLAQPVAWSAFLETRTTHADIETILSDRTLDRLLHPATVAIIGPPNVGKSTLANQLFGRERSITADLPGTTRDWVGEMADVNGVAILLVDTPGVRETDDTIEREAIARARTPVGMAEVVVVVLDATQHLTADTLALLREHPNAIVALNKVDCLVAVDRSKIRAIDVIPLSAKTGVGIDALRRTILQRLGCDHVALEQPRCWTDRQRGLLQTRLDSSLLEAESRRNAGA